MKTFALWVCATAAVIGLGVFLFAWSGLYNVSASSGHFAWTRWFIEFALRRSVATHSLSITAPALQDADLIRLGAGHFAGGCAPCHGAPERPRNPIVRQMLPAPPSLSVAAATWAPEELFWIVQNGLKYTGMPAWTAPARDDEVWAVVAFLLRLPGVEAAEYRELSRDNASRAQPQAREIVSGGAAPTQLTICLRCHDERPGSAQSRLVPRIAGQSELYLEAALTDYATGMRPSGIMQPVAAALDAEAISALARYYASLERDAAAPPGQAAPERIARGERIATHGVQETGIPPCLSCHGAQRAEIFPRLSGQHARYIRGQLRLWRKGLRDVTGRGAIMSTIARRLSEEQIEDVAAYFESLPPFSGSAGSRENGAGAAPSGERP